MRTVAKETQNRFIRSGHMIMKKVAAGHNCITCNILFWKIHYLRYHMEEKTIPAPKVRKQTLKKNTRHQLCNNFYCKGRKNSIL